MAFYVLIMITRKGRSGPTWIDPAVLYTRQQIAERTGLSDEVLGYWIKRKLLVPEGDAAGKGVHHRFHYSQINVAVVLKAFRDHFGANIGKLASLAEALQAAVRLFRPLMRERDAWSGGVNLAEKLGRFRAGEAVEVTLFDPPESENVVRKAAATETEIIADSFNVTDARPSTVIQLAEKLGPGRTSDREIAELMLALPIDPSSRGETYWLMRQTDAGWVITYDADDGTRDRSHIGPAVFLPIGPMLRELWKLPSYNLIWNMNRAAQMRAALKDAGFPDVRVSVERKRSEYGISWDLNGAAEDEVNKALLPFFGPAKYHAEDWDRYHGITADRSDYAEYL